MTRVVRIQALDGVVVEGREPWVSAAYTLLCESGATVRRWTTGSGAAWTSADDWGIVCPPPRGWSSFGIVAHEIGHQLLHRTGTRPRWLEEVQAMRYALDAFDRFQLPQRERWRASAERRLGWGFRKSLRLAKDPAAMAQAMRDACGPELVGAVDLALDRLARSLPAEHSPNRTSPGRA
jgi:hypothetical protein